MSFKGLFVDSGKEFVSVASVFKSVVEMDFYDNLKEYVTEYEKEVSSSDKKILFSKERQEQKSENASGIDEITYTDSSSYFIGSNEQVAKRLIRSVYSLIKENDHEEGQVSLADEKILKIYKEHGESVAIKVMSGLWTKCYRPKHESEYLHFLNCVRNASYYMFADEFITYAVCGVAHEDIVIREAGIALFENWDNPEHKDQLDVLAPTGIAWLDSYKEEVSNSLGE